MFYTEDFKQDEFIYFSMASGEGIAVNLQKNRVILFSQRAPENERGGWVEEMFSIDDLVQATTRAVTPVRHFSGSGSHGGVAGAANALGDGLATSILNKRAKADARDSTGVELHVKTVDRPRRFFIIDDEQERNSVSEAFRQILHDRQMNKPYRVIPHRIGKALRRPTEDEIAEAEAVSMKNKDFAILAGLWVILSVALNILFESVKKIFFAPYAFNNFRDVIFFAILGVAAFLAVWGLRKYKRFHFRASLKKDKLV